MRNLLFGAEAVIVTLAKAWFVGCCVTTVWIGCRVYARCRAGRGGAESIWPDGANEPQSADAPPSLLDVQ